MVYDAMESDPEQWVDDNIDYLYRYALTRLRDPSSAEEAVQETFLAAWKNRETFEERANLRTWLTGILKHKIIDHMRKRAREVQLDAPESEFVSLDDMFDRLGHANMPACSWGGDPEKDLEREEFWACFHTCLSRLPRHLADTFIMRELDDRNRDEICKVLGLTSTNYWVILHRARLKLRECLEKNWFLRSDGGNE